MKIKINEYQKKAHDFACFRGNTSKGLEYAVMGLSEEAGEVSGKFAKALRDEKGIITKQRKKAIFKELGDVCWFIAEISTLLNFSLEEVMQGNIDKLTSRKERGVIHGSGDDR